ncbi:MAG: hypothetical protein KKC37_13275, partial [Proteobacteria bacterium]|nr:hypothetical protein [Pseudomonadota bacterium]
MADNNQSEGQGGNLFADAWVRSVTDFWSQVVSGGSSSPPGDDTGAGAEGESGPESEGRLPRGAFERMQGAWRLAAKATQAVLTSLQDPQA